MGELVTASVTSKEDHGYIMDIGSNTIRGFVPNKTMSKVGQKSDIHHNLMINILSLVKWRWVKCYGV